MTPVLASFSLCTGCTACASACPVGCIVMKPDQNGFPRPEINGEQCIGCLQCQKACPILTPLPVPEQETLAYAVKSTDDHIRSFSSSGGVFSELAKLVFQKGGVVWGAEYDGTFSVKHALAETMEQAAVFRGAKYAQSDLSGVFQQIKKQLADGIWVLFTGLPCQVAGLLSFLGKRYPNLICGDSVCHSVPSPKFWSNYLEYRSKLNGHGESPVSVDLRSKETGWSRYRYSVQIRFPEGQYSALSAVDPFMKLFVGGCLSRESCSSCQFKGVDRLSDLTLGDCWGIWDFDPDFDDDKGISLVLVHSSLGSRLFQELAESCSCHPIAAGAAAERNPAITQACKPHPKREAVRNLLMQKNDYGAASALLQQKSLLEKAKNAVRRFLK